jgi:hypothetical protein
LKEIVYHCIAQKLDASGLILLAIDPGERLERSQAVELLERLEPS